VDRSPTGSLASLRERNRRRVINALSERGAASRAELSRITGLSRSTISTLIADLQAAGLVTERSASAPGGAQGGRPGVLVALDRSAGVVVAVDFGHRRLRVTVYDLAHTVVAERAEDLDIATPPQSSLDIAANLVEELLVEARLTHDDVVGVGMGIPGPISRDTGMLGSATILPAWNGIPVAAAMSDRLSLPVFADNDANLGALAETTFGAGRGATEVAYLKLSSGIGAGLVVGGRLFRGANGTAGEIGHTMIDPNGLVCRCGNRGCLETLAGELGIVDVLRRSHGTDLTLDDVLRLAAEGDLGCRRAIADAGGHIGRATAALCNLVNPERIVVGGSLSAAGEMLLGPLRSAIERHAVPSAARDMTVVQGELGSRTETLGALALVIAESDRLVTQGARPTAQDPTIPAGVPS
jgi:predicted NBD/HSP70 family sugar kinase